MNNQLRWFDGVPAVGLGDIGRGPCFLYGPISGIIESSLCTQIKPKLACQKSNSRVCTEFQDTYQGYLNYGVTGNQCINWADVPSDKLDISQWDSGHKIQKGIHQGNFCRNPTNEPSKKVFCYTMPGDEAIKTSCAVQRCASLPSKFCKISPANKPNQVRGSMNDPIRSAFYTNLV